MFNKFKKSPMTTFMFLCVLGIAITLFVVADNCSKPDDNGNYSNKYADVNTYRATAWYLLVVFCVYIIIYGFGLLDFVEKKLKSYKNVIIVSFSLVFVVIPAVLTCVSVISATRETVYPCNLPCENDGVCQNKVCVCKKGFTGTMCESVKL